MYAIYRPWYGRGLTIFIGAVCVVGAIVTVESDGWRDLIDVVPWLLLVAGGCWAMFWHPRVEVSDGGVCIVNVTRTIDLPWPSIEGIETRWALTLLTTYGRFTAWAAPAPGTRAARRAGIQEFRATSDATDSGVRVGDLPSTPSGEAATLIKQHWDRLRIAGHLDDPRLEHQQAPVTWHVGTLAGAAVLLALGIIGLLT